ncbi:hypothetical protein GGX14DRAFT_369584 [Mycena pura]|uniref:DUF6570 domain-containing protein n=1 Tax=Mycena pura TaxID=153505 RepID=A0AAD6V951_9AGAR|nr:hypothetical protein GGX14DRAFT_369584 [Mycena pura]
MPFSEGLADLFIDPEGVPLGETGQPENLLFCKPCYSAIRLNKLPPLSLTNRNFLGPVPDALKDLTMIEESMIACCRAEYWVVKLTEANHNLKLQSTQRSMKGHVLIYPQQPSRIATILPPSVEEIVEPVCVLFVGSSRPTAEWLRQHAKPLAVNAKRADFQKLRPVAGPAACRPYSLISLSP